MFASCLYRIASSLPMSCRHRAAKVYPVAKLLCQQRNCRGCPLKFAKPFSPPPGWEPAFCPPPRRNPKRCCRSSTSPSFSTASRRRCIPGIQNIIIVTGRGKSRHRRSLRRQLRAGIPARKPQEEGSAGHRARHLRHDQRFLRAPERGARAWATPCCAHRELVGGEPFAVVLADDVIDAETPCLRQLARYLQLLQRARAGRDGSAAGEHLRLWLHRRRTGVAQRQQRPRLPHPRPGGEAEGRRSAVEPRHHRPLRADAGDLRFAAIASTPARAAKSNSPTPCATCCAAGPSTPTASRARATTPAISSVSSRPRSNSRCAATIWAGLPGVFEGAETLAFGNPRASGAGMQAGRPVLRRRVLHRRSRFALVPAAPGRPGG